MKLNRILKTLFYIYHSVGYVMDADDSQDVLIVGAGPGGLASALLLAHSGVKVTMLEKSSSVG